MVFQKLLSIAFLSIFIHYSVQSPILPVNVTDCFQRSTSQVRVFLTISSITASVTDRGIVRRYLELNWYGGEEFPGDTVGIYAADPAHHAEATPLSMIDPTVYPGGYYRSDVMLPVRFFNISSLGEDACVGYWAAYKNARGIVISSSCLKIRPFWMQQNSKYLSNLTLSEIMIPGSHDSGSFYFHKETAPLSKYKYAQEENIFNQLVYGLRYFDLRVGFYKKTKDKYYINHNFLRTQHSVKSVMRQVLEFLKATKEVVILDFHNFPIGFKSDAIHVDLMKLILKTFRPFLIPNTPEYRDAVFRTLWEQNKRILISYDSPVRTGIYNELLWPMIPRAWGNKQYPHDLKLYFESVFLQPLPEGLWASMAELTPNARTIVLHPESGLRIFADEINRNVTHWFRDLYWDKANIVATDYFMGNDIIDVAIQTNIVKGTCPKFTWSPKLK